MTQRNQRSQQHESMWNDIGPQQIAIGVAAAAGAALAGRWLYNNSDKVTMFLGDMAEGLSEGITSTMGDGGGSGGMSSGDGGTTTRNRTPPVGHRVNGEQTSSKRNIPVH
jgi:hypothetical protein